LGSDYVYTRHAATAEYRGRIGHHTYSAEMLVGRVNGEAVPLFDRFILGDTRTLRGWSKFDVAPLGGTRVAHGSLEYTYKCLGVFYDTGAVWDRKQSSDVKQSVGVAFGGRDGIYLALAFPLRGASVQPLFILGMNF
jgi:outer membrane protein assembly factor BamA